ncbi:methyltransferase domain-containing protein [Agaribacter marinus]|uniref:Methyltransferase n=1 Tax=Agaribacter marinus TaxID=1431249 RepID=A0AA37SWK8_9ALTE|nr:methyltransferase domain-containing protein [Agaribacter marinus]GLR69495.1 methyltransferase [Agaribacter marinus]
MLLRAAKRDEKPRYPDVWSRLSQGERVKEELERELAPVVERLFGYYLLKVGALSSELTLATSPIKHKFNFSANISESTQLCGKSNQLPIQNNSVDVFVVLAELDFAQDPHQIVREIDRSITSNGHVVIAGFNPFSLAGIMKYLPINRNNLLHQGRFFTAARVKDWLQLLDFEVIQQEQVIYSSLFMRKRLGEHSRIMRWCKRYCPWFSSMYIIVARKREIPLSPIKQKWHLKPKFNNAPATASMSNTQSSRSNKN